MVMGADKCLQLCQKLYILMYMLFTYKAGYMCSGGHAYLDRGENLNYSVSGTVGVLALQTSSLLFCLTYSKLFFN